VPMRLENVLPIWTPLGFNNEQKWETYMTV
jgi:hypothetical protein